MSASTIAHDIRQSRPEDIDEIFRLYRLASDYQRSKKTVVVWPEFDRGLVEKEIEEGRQWKIVVEKQTACVWAITYSDEQIWEGKSDDAAIYIHRIATNPDFRSQHFVFAIVDWAKEFARNTGKRFIRLDTLGNNTRLIQHYENAGFNFLGFFELSNTSDLPGHYQSGEPACLFEIDLQKHLV
jgi:ribosomal protein S18 acetylase RimI-like enzyme